MSMERKMDIFTKEYRSVIIREEKGVEIMIKKIKKYTKQWDIKNAMPITIQYSTFFKIPFAPALLDSFFL